MKHIIIVLLSFVAGTLSAQFVPYASWEYLNPIPQAATLLSVKMIDTMTYVAVGEGGTVVRTFDDGVTWKVESKVGNLLTAFTSVDFGTPSTGLIATDDYILFTNDTGNTWKPYFVEGTYGLQTVYYATPSRAFCVGTRGEVYSSLDSGKSWVVQRIDTADHLIGIHFLTPEVGYIGANTGALFLTTDGGTSWNKQPLNVPGDVSAIDFTDSLYGVICGGKSVSLTSNGGKSWEKVSLTPKGNANDAVMLSDSRIVVVCDNREAFLSEDFGKTWTDTEPFGSWRFRSVSFVDKRNGVIVGNNGVIMRTRDGGSSWTGETEKITFQSYSLQSVRCFDSLNAIACGNIGTIVRTTDGGKKWSISEVSTTASLYDVHFQTPLIGTIVGEYGTILRTRDAGLTWTNQQSWTVKDDLRHVSFYDTANGIACGVHGVLRMTSNGGRSWSPIVSLDDSIDFADIAYIAPLTVIATVSKVYMDSMVKPPEKFKDSYLLRSTNQGVIWDTILKVKTTIGTLFMPLSFVSEKIGYCLQNYGSITGAPVVGSLVFKTTDGGLTWDTTKSKTFIFGYDMSFVNEHSGTIVGADGVTAHTSDGGETWVSVPSGTTLTLRSVSHGYLNGAFAVGYKTAIIRLTTNDTLVTLSTPVSAASRTELLRNIYPNPAHTTVSIEFALDETTTAGLVIYNVEGKRMGMTTDARYDKGIHTIEYDVSDFPAGFYFVEITTDGKRDMMKFIVQ